MPTSQAPGRFWIFEPRLYPTNAPRARSCAQSGTRYGHCKRPCTNRGHCNRIDVGRPRCDGVSEDVGNESAQGAAVPALAPAHAFSASSRETNSPHPHRHGAAKPQKGVGGVAGVAWRGGGVGPTAATGIDGRPIGTHSDSATIGGVSGGWRSRTGNGQPCEGDSGQQSGVGQGDRHRQRNGSSRRRVTLTVPLARVPSAN